jgi:hypothetical protein
MYPYKREEGGGDVNMEAGVCGHMAPPEDGRGKSL